MVFFPKIQVLGSDVNLLERLEARQSVPSSEQLRSGGLI